MLAKSKFRAHFDLNRHSTSWGWILVALLVVFAVAPLTYPGFFQAHSGFLPAFNVAHPSDAPNWGRVADPLRGDGKLPYLLAWPFWQLSGSGVVALKWAYALAFLLAALGTYGWTRRWLGAKGGVLAAVVYTYLPWHLSAVYVRGAYAEAWLWALLPITLWATDHLAQRQFLAAGAVGLPSLAAATWTQPGLVALYFPLLAAYSVAITHKGQKLILWLVGTLACLLLILWLFAGQVPSEASRPFADHFLHPFQLFSASWGFGTSVPGWDDGMSFQLGLAAVGLSMVALALFLPIQSELKRALLFWAGVLLVLVLLTLPPSAFLWRATNLKIFLSYPWQLLTLAGLPLAFLAGSAVRLDERLAELPAWAGLLALVILSSYAYLAPRFTQVDPGSEPVAMFQPVGADAPQIAILDYEIVSPSEITPTLTLTLTWQTVEPLADDYTIFVHLLAPDGSKVAQRDTRPCDGECLTNTWQPGEIIVDRYQLSLAPDAVADLLHAPSGRYRLAVGLYLLDSGERAAVVGRDDEVMFFDAP